MKTKLIVILFAVGIMFLCGCENHYAMVTEEGVLDLPLSKILRTAQSPQQLYPVLSEAIDAGDKKRIEKRIVQLQGAESNIEGRHYNQRDDYLTSQAERRINYVNGRFLSDDMKRTILSGGVIAGMSKKDFIASRGEPDEIKTVETENGTADVFIQGMFDKKSYYFIDGKLEYWF